MALKKYLILALTMFIVSFISCSKSDKPSIHNYLLPAYAAMQSSANHFDKQVENYKNSVLLGDSFFIESSKKTSQSIMSNLQNILNQKDLPSNSIAELNELLSDYSNYTDQANKFYLSLAEGKNFDDVLKSQMSKLAKNEFKLESQFFILSNRFYDDLKKEIESINNNVSYFQTLNKRYGK